MVVENDGAATEGEVVDDVCWYVAISIDFRGALLRFAFVLDFDADSDDADLRFVDEIGRLHSLIGVSPGGVEDCRVTFDEKEFILFFPIPLATREPWCRTQRVDGG